MNSHSKIAAAEIKFKTAYFVHFDSKFKCQGHRVGNQHLRKQVQKFTPLDLSDICFGIESREQRGKHFI